jgi:ElaB/YqjD/DUF883 family membrane-anchored ribosome-binding protein
MMYSPEPMDERKETPDLGDLEEKVSELERLADALGSVPDDELVGTLNRAVELLREVNTRLEANLDAVVDESRGINTIIDGLDLGPFDEALGGLEQQERDAGET